MSDWTGVRERVLALAAVPEASQVFGARGHGFHMEDPLTAAELAEAESVLGIELPEDYRTFLVQVGAGGAGPAYGLFPIQRAGEGSWQWVGDGADLTEPGLASVPFPGPVDAAALALILADRPEEEDFEDVEDFDPVYEAWDERLAGLLWTPEHTAGAICLCHEGCANRVWLIVAGPERGRMWADPRVDDADLHPLTGIGGGPVDFRTWYLDWLGAAESACGLVG
jgi:hypothetical protein